MNFIKIVLRTGKDFTFSEEKALAILESEEQLIRVYDAGKWTGTTINKADISYTEWDKEKTRDWNRKHTPELPEPETDKLSQEEIRQRCREIGQQVRIITPTE